VFGVAVPGYAALYSVSLNFLLAIGLTPIFDALSSERRPAGE
jgi:hypothetical protein